MSKFDIENAPHEIKAELDRIKSPLPKMTDDSLQRVIHLKPDDVKWIVNDNAELGVMIGEQCFFLYKGDSLVYEDGLHDDGTPMHYRPVFKREFGECCHPVNYANPNLIGTVSLDNGEWKPLPAALSTTEGCDHER